MAISNIQFELSDEQFVVYRYLDQYPENFFITGKAGTGNLSYYVTLLSIPRGILL